MSQYLLVLALSFSLTIGTHAGDLFVARSGELPQTAPAPLAEAAEAGDWKVVGALLGQGTDVNQTQPDGMTAMHWAVYHNQISAVEQLIAAHSNVDARTRYGAVPLQIACSLGYSRIVDLLLAAGAGPNSTSPAGETALMVAARTGSAESIQRLIAAGAVLDAREKAGQTALMWAAAEGNVESIKVLIDAGADLNASSSAGFTAMMFAARDGQLAAVKQLIAAGVDVNTAINSKTSDERAARNATSALIFAVESGHFELAMELVACGADPNDQRNGFTPLHIISWVRKPNSGDDPSGDPPPRGSGNLTDLQFVRAIIAAGADVNATLDSGKGGRAMLTPRGSTPLMFAARTADVALMKTLVELGADPLAPNVDGTTPLLAAAGIGVRAVDEEAGTELEVVAAVDYLVSLGAAVDTVDNNLETAMHGAAYRNFPLVVKRLAEHGSDSHIWMHKNKYGWTPVMIAQGQRPGSFKPSPRTEQALQAAISTK